MAMDSKRSSSPVGVIGGGSFGTALANLLAPNSPHVLFYIRDVEKAALAIKQRESSEQKLADNIEITNDISRIGIECQVIFPAVPSEFFRDMMRNLSPHLHPYHIVIHGTKGFDLQPDANGLLTKDGVKTMSEVIAEESTVVRIGCLAGPNLAREIAEKKPAATVIASKFDEVVERGQRLLKNDRFLVYGGKDLVGTELCGVLKNIIAVGSGLISGLNMGENAKALLISRGLVEMIHIGKAFGADGRSFLGLAGVGDLIATCGSQWSRNFIVGTMLAKGMKVDEIMELMNEVAEGIKTINTVYQLSETLKFKCVITEMLFKIINEDFPIAQAQIMLMKLPFQQEVDFLD